MIRHNYVNCTVCHVSPTGGGLLTQYGRALSVEVLSTWGKENEGAFLHGLVPTDKFDSWLNLGGDFRGLQAYSDTNTARRTRFFLMQADLEAAITVGKFTFYGTWGALYKRPDNVYDFGSRNYYAMYQLSDEVHVRMGRYYAAFGLNVPDHRVYTRRDLGFDENQETQNLEVGWLTEKASSFVSVSRTRPELRDTIDEESLSAQFDYTFFGSYKVGIGRWVGRRPNAARTMTSVHGALGFTSRSYFMFDAVLQEMKNYGGSDSRGIFIFTRPGYEIFKGFHVIGIGEMAQSDLRLSSTIKRKAGFGFEFYPRPHFEIQLVGYKEEIVSVDEHWNDYAYLVFHYWL